MEKIIFRKFFFDLLSFFLIVSISLSLITWIIQSVNYLDLISKDGHGFKIYFAFISLNFPKIFSKVIIFSYFISLFYIIQKYQENNEILIFWTNGISKIKLVNFILKISFIFAILQIFFVNFIIPKLQDESRNYIRSSNIDLFTSLISEKKFIDTVKDFTIFVDKIDEQGNFENIFIKDAVDKLNTQIITAQSGNIIENMSEKFLILNFGQILDLTNNDIDETKIIKFNNTTFNLSNFKTKTTTHPKLQELNSKILFDCFKSFLIGNKKEYTLPNFQCSERSAIKSAKELFHRSIKQLYIIALGVIATFLIFNNSKNEKYLLYKIIIFFIGIFFIILSEVNSEFLNFSLSKNIFFGLFPIFFLAVFYLLILNFNNKRF